MRPRRIVLSFAALLALALAAVALWIAHRLRADEGPPDPALPLSYAERTGSVFLPAATDRGALAAVADVSPPPFDGAEAIWGATGRDRRGRLWIGVSSRAGAGASARLYSRGPDGAWQERGQVLAALAEAGVLRAGEQQAKIHSKPVQADDGRLYFASTDEEDEDPGGGRPPRWGGHLWRLDPDGRRWQHLAAVPEGLVAVAGAGRHVFALGYFGHVLYRYDTQRDELKRVVVGAAGGHVSRNLLATIDGHAFVPRVSGDGAAAAAELVEFDAELHELGATPLAHYLGGDVSLQSNHGIVGFAYLPNGNLVFTTHRGQLYLIERTATGPARVVPLGWLHPDGEAYAPSLFALSDNQRLAGVVQRGGRYQWVVRDLYAGTAAAAPLDTLGLTDVLLYGSVTRDDAGCFYVGGWTRVTGAERMRPLLLRLTPAG